MSTTTPAEVVNFPKLTIVDLTEEQAKEMGVDQPKAKATSTKVEVDLNKVHSMKEAKELCKKAPVAGLLFVITHDDNRHLKAGQLPVSGKVLPTLSEREKVRAELTCANPGCTETHTREVSDWHQSGFCRTHASATGKLTPEQKAAKLQAKAAAILAKG